MESNPPTRSATLRPFKPGNRILSLIETFFVSVTDLRQEAKKELAER